MSSPRCTSAAVQRGEQLVDIVVTVLVRLESFALAIRHKHGRPISVHHQVGPHLNLLAHTKEELGPGSNGRPRWRSLTQDLGHERLKKPVHVHQEGPEVEGTFGLGE
jgi:hypothetical protein